MKTLAPRIVLWAAVFATLALVVNREPGHPIDARATVLNPCGVETLTPFAANGNPSAIDVAFGNEASGTLWVFNSNLTVGGTKRDLYGPDTTGAWFAGENELNPPPPHPSRSLEYRFTAPHGPVPAATYDVRALPGLRTARVTLRVPGAPAGSSAGFAATLSGFDTRVPDATSLAGDSGARTGRPWVALTNGRCTLLVWGKGLRTVRAVPRTIGYRIADYEFGQPLDAGGAATLNLSYVYGAASDERSLGELVSRLHRDSVALSA